MVLTKKALGENVSCPSDAVRAAILKHHISCQVALMDSYKFINLMAVRRNYHMFWRREINAGKT